MPLARRLTEKERLVMSEFSQIQLGDKRLDKRLVEIGIDFINAPGESIPQMNQSWAKTKAAYRFFDNQMVTNKKILQSHRERTNERMRRLEKVLLVTDTTFFTFPSHPSKNGLGEVGAKEDDVEGVLAHSTIAVEPSSGRMLGVYDQQIIIRLEEGGTILRKGDGESLPLENEGEKWNHSVEETLSHVPEGTQEVYVFDRGGDTYSVLKELKTKESGFLIRSNQNRAIRTEDGQRGRLHEWIKQTQEKGRFKKELQKNRKGDREEMILSVRSGCVQLLAPHPKRQGMEDEGALEVHVLYVREENAREGQEPAEWILLTDQPVETLEQIREVIGHYEHRWVIEEWHGCLKEGGTKFEDRQLQEWERMERLLGVTSVVAWRLLGLRDLSRTGHQADPEKYLTEAQRKVIEHMDAKVSEGQDAKEYFLGIARIGGYLDRTNDPPPGWKILWRGFKKVQTMAAGFEIAN